tara:strand:- start:12359 stop:12583 length:225 start_codon:yes stop_codon:yes gene_type:complete
MVIEKWNEKLSKFVKVEATEEDLDALMYSVDFEECLGDVQETEILIKEYILKGKSIEFAEVTDLQIFNDLNNPN